MFYQFYYSNDREQNRRFIKKCEALLFLVANVRARYHDNNTEYQIASFSWQLRLSVTTGIFVHCSFFVNISAKNDL